MEANFDTMPIRVAIVEDQPGLLKNMIELIGSFPQLHLVFTALNGEDVVEKMKFYHDKVDVILMDIEMPGMNGIEATSRIKKAHPGVTILMLTVFAHRENLMQAMAAGADGYLLKGEKGEALVLSVQQSLEGRMPLSPTMAAHAMAQLRSEGEKNAQLPELKEFSLSKRETEIYELLVQARTYTQIAEELFISPKTVRRHMENLYKKLAVHSKAEAIGLAHRNGWF